MLRRTTRTLLATLGVPLFAAAAVDLPPQYLPVYGGSGGSAYTRSCSAGYALSGLRYRKGATFDAVGILCRPILSDGHLGPETTVGTLVGGGGGTVAIIHCPTGTIASGAEIDYATYLGRVILYCRTWNASTRTFGGTTSDVDTGFDLQPFKTAATELCEAAAQPVHAIRGRAGIYVDAFGLICDEP